VTARRSQRTRSGSTSSTTWAWAAVGSIVFHVGLVLLSMVIPDGGRSSGAASQDRLFTPGAVIPIELAQVATHAEPTRESMLPAKPAVEAEAPPATAPVDHPQSSTPHPRAGAERPPDPTEAHAETDPSRSPGLALHGMRETSRAATAGKVVVDPALLQGSRELYEQSVNNPGVGDGAVQGPAPAPSSGRDLAFKKENGKWIYRDPAGGFTATLNPDGRVNFRNKGAKATWTNIGMAGPGDLLSAAGGEDPYARLKAKLLEATFEMRLGMAVDFQKAQLAKRLKRLDGDLDKIWADENRDLRARKELLFQRWDECDEPDEAADVALPGFGSVDSSDLDRARQDAASSARKRILKFIREHAPKGSAEAFTAAELADMNRRRASKQKFSPYE
jgi:hypothetical protein